MPLSLVGSLAQITVTATVGMAALGLYVADLGWERVLAHPAFVGLGFAGALVLLVAYFRLPRWIGWLPQRWLETRVGRGLQEGAGLRGVELRRVIGWSAARYGVFTAQYLVLLTAYGISVDPVAGGAAIGTIFLVQSVLPNLAVLEPLKRGSVAFYLLGAYTGNELGVVAASATLWVLNLLIPAVAGYVLMLAQDPFRR